MAISNDIEEAQMNRALHPQEEVSKPAWLSQNDQFTVMIFTVAAVVLLQPLSGNELDIHFTIPLALIMFLLYIFTGGTMLCRYLNPKPSSTLKVIIVLLLNLLVAATLMAANVAFLGMFDKSYLPLALIPILGFILVARLLHYSKQEPQDHGLPVANKDNETMVKNCFKAGNYATSMGFNVQIAVVNYGLRNNVPPQNLLQYSSILAAFLTSTLGSFSTTITSSPLQFPSDLMCCLLKEIHIILLLLQGLVAALVSAKFLDPVKIVLAVGIPSIAMFLVNLCQKSSTLQVADEDNNSIFGALANFGIAPILAIYLVKLESGECTTYLTYSVFFLLLATMTSLMRMALILRPPHTVIEHVSNALPMVLTLIGVVAGVVLLLIECYTYATSMGQVLSPSPN